MPFCPQCGVDNPAAARYCDQCGAMLIPVANQPAAPAAPPPTPNAPPVAAPLMSGTLVCSQCGTQAIPGEAFCDNCGASLSAPTRPAAAAPTPPYNSNVSPQPSYPAPQQSGKRLTPPPAASTPPVYQAPPAASAPPVYQAPPSYSSPVAPPAATTRTALAPARMVVLTSGAMLMLPNTPQAVVGRGDPVSNFFPDIDLTPHGALDQGVGRRHLRLFVLGAQVMVEDLDSTNGTHINGQKLAARQPQALRNGDTLEVGRLALRFQE